MSPNPTSCPVQDTELLAYRDGELAASRQRSLAVHIERCPSCQARLDQAAFVTATLTLGTPPRDQPVARAAIHDQIASGQAAWWRRRALIGTALPAVLVLLAVIGFNRWAQDETCESCPLPPPPMRITAVSGLPAGWSSLLPCPTAPPSNRLHAPGNQQAPAARTLLVPLAEQQAEHRRVWTPRTNLQEPTGPRLLEQPQPATANVAACAPGNLARQPGPGDGPELGQLWPDLPSS